MKKYKITILPIAVEDIINIRADIIKRYGDVYNADKIINRIFDGINTLASLPKATEVRLIVSELGLRFLRIGKYTAIYYVDDIDNTVKICGVFYSRRDFTKIIEDRI
ncbi:type II toxin-antitoxin system RelE/ParE family toxin [Candidatus Saccharibacteria bacterium]|nr:type II toxin-antitoxin system RelE/ParE family toxin [Candidatus Saccharibacteria bacterium]